MKLQSRCPHCHQIEPIHAGTDTQSAHACPSCGLRYVPHRHMFVADALTDVRIAVRDDPVLSPPGARPPSQQAAGSTAPARRRISTRTWSLITLVLVLVLAAQISLHHRHLWAARWPWLQPTLRTLCLPLGCRIQAPEVMDAVSVVTSGFDQLENGAFVFSLHLRHDLSHPVATPAIELILTDEQERPVLRKVLLSEHIGLANVMPSGPGLETETRFELDLELHGHVSGFRVELFYP